MKYEMNIAKHMFKLDKCLIWCETCKTSFKVSEMWLGSNELLCESCWEKYMEAKKNENQKCR